MEIGGWYGLNKSVATINATLQLIYIYIHTYMKKKIGYSPFLAKKKDFFV